jgi:hypothetical protein
VTPSLCTAAIAAWIWYGPGQVAAQARPHDGLALGDELPVPERPVLVGQPDHAALGVGAGGAPGLDEEEQREEPVDLGLVGHEPDEQACEADRLGAQLARTSTSPCEATWPSLKTR